ncbi:MAG: cereblon family protein [Ignavibacteria bacterium]|jgi:hypothetical protein
MNSDRTQKMSDTSDTQLKPEVEVKTELQPDDWLCLVCNKKITSDKDRFEFNGQSEFQFINPGGFYFDIITFSVADGCQTVGESTMEFTWFPEHLWSIAVCIRCKQQLGWKYQGKYSFYGLIKSRLIKGAALFN